MTILAPVIHPHLISTLYYFLLSFEPIMRLSCIISSQKSIIKVPTPLMLKHHLTWMSRLKRPCNTFHIMEISDTLHFIIFKIAMLCISLRTKHVALLLHNSCLHRSLNSLTLDRLCQTMFSRKRNASVYRIKTDTLLFLTYSPVSLMSLTSISPGLWIQL